jgi:uncharacterized protein (UPF0333 family)
MQEKKLKLKSAMGITHSHHGQAAIEGLVILAFILIIFIPVMFIGISSITTENEKISIAQAKSSLRTMTGTAEEVYLAGEISRKTILVYYPDRLDTLNISSHELKMRLNMSYGQVDLVETTFANLSDGGIQQGFGYHQLNMSYRNDGGKYVEIRDK